MITVKSCSNASHDLSTNIQRCKHTTFDKEAGPFAAMMHLYIENTRMIKTIYSALMVAAFLFSACTTNDKQANKEARVKDSTQIKTSEIPPAVSAGGQEKKATAELCDCVNASLTGMSPKVRQILIDASKSANPVVVLTTELQKINSEEEQERLATEFQKFESDPAMQRCSEDVTKKYGIDENNKESQQKVLKAAAENKACEVTYALMKIGLQYEKLNSER